MSYVTPLRTSPRIKRASESKRALFQQPNATPTTSHRMGNSDDSCDLGIMSTIDTDSSDIDQFVPVTPNSWRSTSRSNDKRKSVKEILKSPLTFRNYTSRHGSQSSISSRISDFLVDTESCSSSLKDLRFHSDSDLSDGAGKTPEKRISKNTRRYPLRNYDLKNNKENTNTNQNVFKRALKNLHFEQVDFCLPDEVMEAVKSPLKMLKTPHENSTNVKTPPRIHHKSLKDNNSKTVENDQEKSSRLSANIPAPKARLSLFGNGEIKLSPKSFYPKSVTQSVSDISKLHNTIWPTKQSKSHRSSRFSHKKSRKRGFGEINKGVWHGIHKPKPKAVSKEKALSIALKIIENSKLNDYIEQFMSTKDKTKNGSDQKQTSEIGSKKVVTEIEKDIQQVNQTLKQFGCDISVESLVNNVAKANELAATFQVNKPIDLMKSLQPPKPVFDLNRSLMSNRSYCDLNQSFDSLNRSTDLNMSFTESEMTYDDAESVMSDLETGPTNRKIFKARSTESKKAVIKMRNLKLEMDNGKIHLLQKKQHTSNDGMRQIWTALENKIAATSALHLDASDLLSADEDEESFRIPEMSAIESLLSQWKEEDVPRTEPLIQQINKTNDNCQSEHFSTIGNNTMTDFNTVQQIIEENSSIDNIFVNNLHEDVSGQLDSIEASPLMEYVRETSSTSDSSNQKSDNITEDSSSPVKCEELGDSDQNKWPINEKKRKMYPIFDKDMVKTKQARYDESCKVDTTTSIANKFLCRDKNQYIIDAGQKNFGVTQCPECGVIYHIGDPDDERDHMIHHTGLHVLRFNGWKWENECGRWESGRVLLVQPGDPPMHWKKVEELLERIVHPQLGYAAPLSFDQSYKVYLYIEKKKIIGCLVAEVVPQAFKMLPGEDCISIEAYPVKCGISRLWSHVNYRRQNIATRLVDCLRATFFLGHIMGRHEVAFSTPTPSGRAFAAKYVGKEDFYVYQEVQS